MKVFHHIVLPVEDLIALLIETRDRIRIHMLRLDMSHQGPFVFEGK